jgi:hypothetical protein
LKTLLEYARLIRLGPQADSADDQVRAPQAEKLNDQPAATMSKWWYLIGAFALISLAVVAAAVNYRRARNARS